MLLRTVRRLVEDGHSVLVTLPSDGPLKAELEGVGCGVHISNIDPILRKSIVRNPVRFLADLVKGHFSVYKKLLTEFSPELICSNSSIILSGALLARKLAIPHIFHVRESYESWVRIWPLYRAFLLNYSAKIIPVSKAMANQFPARFHGNKVVVIHDGFPLDEFDPVGKERIECFKEQFALGDFLVIGLVGRIILQRKGQDVFVRAVKILKEKRPDVKFAMIGSCYPGNEFHLDNLNRLIDELGVCDSVVLTGEAEDVKVAYSAFDISVMASATPEPFGGVTIESMAFGKPVVGTNIGGTSEQIVDGETGILIPPDDPAAMASAIEALLENEELRIRMGKAGRKRFEEEFTFEPYYEHLMKVYEEVLV